MEHTDQRTTGEELLIPSPPRIVLSLNVPRSLSAVAASYFLGGGGGGDKARTMN